MRYLDTEAQATARVNSNDDEIYLLGMCQSGIASYHAHQRPS